MATLADRAASLWASWQASLPLYAESCLRILTKDDELRPLRFNPMQQELHRIIEEQRASLGRVRVIILKARQLGCSTYVAARFFWHTHLPQKGRRAYLLAHEDDACIKLVAMYRTMYDNHTPPELRRDRIKSNDHGFELVGGGCLESDTASTPAGGRGGTKTIMHWSEVAFSRHYAAHSMGSMQQLGKRPGTEIILESTPNGPVGGFYERWRTAEAGRGDYIPIYFPWWIDPDYTADGSRFVPSHDAPNEIVLSEYEYQQAHGLSNDRMQWRREKIEELSADGADGALHFAQEYSATPEEAFLGVSGDSLLSPAQVEAARLRPTFIGPEDEISPLVMGLDPAPGHSSSASALAWRRGGKNYRLDRRHGLDAHALIEYVYREFVDAGADRLCIDTSEGTGQAVYTELSRRPATAGKVVAVVFGGRSSDRSRWYNLRAEIWHKMASWIADGGAIVDERGETGQTLASELLSVHRKRGNERVIQIEAKEEVVKRIGRSPDGADALACTFAKPDPTPYEGGTWIAGMDGAPGGRVQRPPGGTRVRLGGGYGAGSGSVYHPRSDVEGF